MKKINIAIADDHRLVVEGLVALIHEENDMEIIGIASNGKELLQILSDSNADLVIMDIEMPELNGIDATRIIHEKFPKTKVLALSMYNESALIKEMTMAGAKGYILKNISKSDLVSAIRNIIDGNFNFSQELYNYNSNSFSSLPANNLPDLTILLTKREKEILILLAEGASVSEISERLCISPRTVDTHRTNMMKKLNINSISKLVSIAYKTGLCK